MPEENENAESRNLGLQPLDAVLEVLELNNRDLVEASTEQLTHKQVQKARKGRRVTPNIQHKILNALRNCTRDDEEKTYQLSDLFNYRP